MFFIQICDIINLYKGESMNALNNPYLTIVNSTNKYNEKDFEGLVYNQIPVTKGDRKKTSSFVEKQTHRAAIKAIQELISLGVKKETIEISSAGRDDFDQEFAIDEFYKSELAENGNNPQLARQTTDEYCAKVGHSEHHSGLALDIKVPTKNMAIPKEIEQTYNGDRYKGGLGFITKRLVMERNGFILSYPLNSRLEQTTGVKHNEPWHWRYIGPEHSKRIAKLRDLVSTEEIVTREKIKLEEVLKEQQKTDPTLTDEKINQKVNSVMFEEVFLEDYVKLLQLDIKADTEEELLQEYADYFVKNILGYGENFKLD